MQNELQDCLKLLQRQEYDRAAKALSDLIASEQEENNGL